MGCGGADKVRKAEESVAACTIVSYDDGELHGVYKTDITDYTGPGKVHLQTMTIGKLARQIIPYIPNKK